jgi:hypothetical protein
MTLHYLEFVVYTTRADKVCYHLITNGTVYYAVADKAKTAMILSTLHQPAVYHCIAVKANHRITATKGKTRQ